MEALRAEYGPNVVTSLVSQCSKIVKSQNIVLPHGPCRDAVKGHPIISPSTVRVLPAPGMGNGLFALQPIAKGDVILVDRPMLTMPPENESLPSSFLSSVSGPTRRNNNNKNRKQKRRAAASDDDLKFAYFAHLLDGLTPSQLARLDELDARDDDEDDDEDDDDVQHQVLDTATLAREPAIRGKDIEGVRLLLRRSAAFRTNCVNTPYGKAVCPAYSRINHSCLPNAATCFTKDDCDENSDSSSNVTVIVRASRAIAAGEQIHITYVDDWIRLSAERSGILQESWGFACTCPACDPRIATLEGYRVAAETRSGCVDSGYDDDDDDDRDQAEGQGINIFDILRVHARNLIGALAAFDGANNQKNGQGGVTPIPQNTRQALALAEELISILQLQGLRSPQTAPIYRTCSQYALEIGDKGMALRYAVQELDIVRSWKGSAATGNGGNKNDKNTGNTKNGPEREKEEEEEQEDPNESAAAWARFVVFLNRRDARKKDETTPVAATKTINSDNSKLQSRDDDEDGNDGKVRSDNDSDAVNVI